MAYVQIIAGLGVFATAAAAVAQMPAAQVTPFQAVAVEGGAEVIVRPGRIHSYRVTRGSPQALIITNKPTRGLRIRCRPNACRGLAPRIEVTAPRVTAYAAHGGGTMRIDRGSYPIDSLALAAHGGGRMYVQPGSPSVNSLALAAHGGGLIDARAISATHVAASAHGGGTILTYARSNLAASVHGGGKVIYSGSPANVATSINGGGTITPAGGRR